MRLHNVPAYLRDAFQVTLRTLQEAEEASVHLFFKLAINPYLISGALGLNLEVLCEKEDGVYRQAVLF